MPTTRQDDVYQVRMLRVIEYIDGNIGANLSLDVLSDQASLSKYHFHRIFVSYVGEQPHVYVRRLRLERAAKKLQENAGTISVISKESGYLSVASFSKAFSNHFGSSPKTFRQS